MNRFIPPFILSFMTLSVVTNVKPVSARFICDAKDELIETIYNDPFYSKARNHKHRDQLIMRIIRTETVCSGKD